MQRARSTIAAVAAVTGALHCGFADPPGGADPSGAPDEIPRAAWASRWAEPDPWPVTELEVLDAERFALARVDSNVGSSVTSTATVDDGTRFVAGVFTGAIGAGAAVLTSHGGDDVFLARVGPDGRVVWARAIGSKGRESGPKVTFDDGRVKLLAMTDGAVDCGRGPLQTWSSEAFFLCTFDPDGEPIDGASFPTGRR